MSDIERKLEAIIDRNVVDVRRVVLARLEVEPASREAIVRAVEIALLHAVCDAALVTVDEHDRALTERLTRREGGHDA